MRERLQVAAASVWKALLLISSGQDSCSDTAVQIVARQPPHLAPTLSKADGDWSRDAYVEPLDLQVTVRAFFSTFPPRHARPPKGSTRPAPTLQHSTDLVCQSFLSATGFNSFAAVCLLLLRGSSRKRHRLLVTLQLVYDSITFSILCYAGQRLTISIVCLIVCHKIQSERPLSFE